MNITAGLVLSDRILRPDLLCSPADGLANSRDLIDRWHGRGRLSYRRHAAVLAVRHRTTCSPPAVI